jgi:hypothetical protein
VADDVSIEEPCTGCSWPGRCAAYGSEGCRMKAEERLQVVSVRLGPHYVERGGGQLVRYPGQHVITL